MAQQSVVHLLLPLPLLIVLLLNVHVRTAQACPVSMSSPQVDCALRGYWIQPDANNQTPLTAAIYNLVYNSGTSNATVWTVARRLAFQTYWNAIHGAIWDNGVDYVSMDLKINRIVYLLGVYSGNVCSFQAYFYGTPVCASGIRYGTVGDFVACGNVTSAYKLSPTKPVTSAPVGVDANGCPVPLATVSSTTPTTTSGTSSTTTTSALTTTTKQSTGAGGLTLSTSSAGPAASSSNTISSTSASATTTATAAPACTCLSDTIAEVFGKDSSQFNYYQMYVQSVCAADKCQNSFTKGCFTDKANTFPDYYFSQLEVRCTDWAQFCACPLNNASGGACLTFSNVVASDCTPGTANCPSWLGLDTYCQTANDPTTCATYISFHGTCDCSGTAPQSTLSNGAGTKNYTCCDAQDNFRNYGNLYVPFTVRPTPYPAAAGFAVSCSGCAPIQSGGACPQTGALA